MKNIFNIFNKKTILFAGAAIVSSSFALSDVQAQQVTGLSDFTIYLDPGHALKENAGLYGYTEAEKTVRVALAIREYLQTHTDIKTVYMCREDDNKQITLSQRTDEANALDVDFYYSIHSDAGTPDVNSTLTMYGGWNNSGVTIEKTPNGGKAFGDALCPDLTGVMRLSTRGNLADQINYNGNIPTHSNQHPYLHVNRESNMASLLSEAGYHTNPTQQQRNINAEWKRMEGLSAFRSILEYMNVARPDLGILSGVITDDETGVPANGVTVKITGTDKTYTTDTYESVFNKYSKDPDELHNGFYFIEGFTAGENLTVEFSSPHFESQTKTITIATNPTGRTAESLNSLDLQLKNIVPSKVKEISARDLDNVVKDKPLVITFTRKMDRTLTESAISITPSAPVVYTWKDDYTLSLDITGLEFETNYTLTIDGSIAKNTHTDNFLDGDGDGVEGGDYVLPFTTAEQDVEAPYVVSYDPADTSESPEARPVIRIEFNETLDEASITENQLSVSESGVPVEGVVRHVVVNRRSVLHYMFNEDLKTGKTYAVNMLGGLKDLYGNEIVGGLQYSFSVTPRLVEEVINIDDFTTVGAWWHPNGSGSTSGINTDVSKTSSSTETYSVDSPTSLMMTYLWDESHTGMFRIRLYRNSKAPKFTKDYILQAYVLGDASNNNFRLTVRDTEGIKSQKPIPMDWAGWKLISWDMANDECVVWLTGGDPQVKGQANFENVGFEAPAKPAEFNTSYILVDDLRLVRFGDYVGIQNPSNADKGLTIKTTPESVELISDVNIKAVEVYSLAGVLVNSVSPSSSEYTLDKNTLQKGIYILNVVTEKEHKAVKVTVQ